MSDVDDTYVLHGVVGPVVLALVAAAGAGAPSSYAPHSVAGSHPAASQTVTTTSSAPSRAADRCGSEPRDAAGWTRLFGSLDGDWAGGDAALSVRLPDDRLLWLFGDSFIGDVAADGSRASGSRMVHNAALITRGGCATAGTPGRETLPGRHGTWLWPTSLLLQRVTEDGSATVVVFAQRIASTGPGPWDFRRVGAAAATLRVTPEGRADVTHLRDLPRSDVLWGAATVRRGGFVYVYGTREVDEPLVFGRELLVARSLPSKVTQPDAWEFRTQQGWSRSRDDAAVIVPAQVGVSTNPAVVMRSGLYRIVTKPQEFLDDRVVEMTSANPYGPWTSRTLFRMSSTSLTPTYSPAVVDANAAGHDIVVVSRTSTDLRALMSDARATLPVFRDVDLSRP